MKFKLTIHQVAALWWLITGAAIFLPLVPMATKPDAGMKAWSIIASVTVVIALVPVALRARIIRQSFCWTDALTEQERKLLTTRNGKAFGRLANTNGYVHRVKPYLLRVVALFSATAIVPSFLPESLDLLRLFVDAIGWYCCGVLLLNVVVLLLILEVSFKK